jgi:glycosyltransferase involved in cell wall biosynthesis
LKVVHLSTYQLSGGAARACRTLHESLADRGIDSRLVVREIAAEAPFVSSVPPLPGAAARLRRVLRRARIRLEYGGKYPPPLAPKFVMFSDDRADWPERMMERLPEADVINLHWVAGFVDYVPFFSAPRRGAKLAWTLHDMNPFTGGCHCDLGCGRYRSGCGVCPQLGSPNENDPSRRVFERKRVAFGRLGDADLHLVFPSRWLAGKAADSPLLGRFPVSVIPNSTELSVFTPRDRAFSREIFGLPQGDPVVLFVGSTVQAHKGAGFLLEALSGLAPSVPLRLAVAGGSPVPGSLPFPVCPAGVVPSPRLMSFLYAAADLVVVPSIQDNLPNAAIEAAACGVPVVGFDGCGVAEVVRHGETGLLVPSGDSASLRDAIGSLLRDPARRAAMGRAARVVAEAAFAPALMVSRYVDLYTRLAGERAGTT